MNLKNYKLASREDRQKPPNQVTGEQNKIGIMQRIADVLVFMAVKNAQLVRERDYYKNSHAKEISRRRKMECSNRALRSVISRLQNKLKNQ